jgi:hypothetical protein
MIHVSKGWCISLNLGSYPEKYYYFWAMKTKRGIYYILVFAGAGLLFLASSFSFSEVGLALGFALLMAGLYGLSKGRDKKDQDRFPNTSDE